MRESFVRGIDNLNLKLSEYPVHNSNAVFICVHGMAEHRKRYERLVLELNQKGYSVITYDHRGHGESLLEDGLGYLGVDGFDNMVADLDLIVSYAQKNYPKKKIFLLGHSMGSFIVQAYVQNYKKVAGIILIGSSYKIFGTKLLKMLAALACEFKDPMAKGEFFDKMMFGKFNNAFKPNRTKFDWLNRNEAEVDKYVNDPLCGQILSNQFYYDFLKGLITIQKEKNISKIKKSLPILILSGDNDPVGLMGKKVQALFEVYRKYSSKVELKLYQGARHEILLEDNYLEVYNDITKWIERNL